VSFHIVADENIHITPGLRAIASSMTLLPGRTISRRDLSFADILLVRSVTRVDRELVANTPLKFVGTATAGLEHIDTRSLADLSIGFAAAPGSNAIAVVEYVLTALAAASQLERVMAGASVGILGYGAVGQHLARVLSDLGAVVQVWDPYVEIPPSLGAGSLDTLMTCDVVSLHAALHSSDPWPSRGVITPELVTKMQPNSVLVNAGRGGLVSREALLQAANQQVTLLLDTWPNEPDIDAELLRSVVIGTPHIAGYSFEAKARATDQLVAAIHSHMLTVGAAISSADEPKQSDWMQNSTRDSETDSPADDSGCAAVIVGGSTPNAGAQWLTQLLLEHYPIDSDDEQLRNCAQPNVRGEDFDALRRGYVLRKEITGTQMAARVPTEYQFILDALGITLVKGE